MVSHDWSCEGILWIWQKTTGKHKDRLFTFMYGYPENRSWTLSLYNAVNGTDYADASSIQFTTIDTIMYLGMHNDVSFLIEDELSLYEQQSSYNPNMPLRMLQYLSSLYEKHITRTNQNKHGGKLMRLPAPRFVAFYNGTVESPMR